MPVVQVTPQVLRQADWSLWLTCTVCVHEQSCIHTVHVHVHTIYTCMCTCTYYIHVCVHVHTIYMYVYMYIWYTFVCSVRCFFLGVFFWLLSMSLCMFTALCSLRVSVCVSLQPLLACPETGWGGGGESG